MTLFQILRTKVDITIDICNRLRKKANQKFEQIIQNLRELFILYFILYYIILFILYLYYIILYYLFKVMQSYTNEKSNDIC